MKIDLFKRVALKIDIPEHRCAKATLRQLSNIFSEDGYVLEVFNAIGETLAVITVPESAVEPLTADKILSARPLAKTG